MVISSVTHRNGNSTNRNASSRIERKNRKFEKKNSKLMEIVQPNLQYLAW